MGSTNRLRSVQSSQRNRRASFHMQNNDARSQISTPVGQTSQHRTHALSQNEKSTLELS